MGWGRRRKGFKVGRTRINVGKRGITSVSTGGRGFRVNLSKRGTRVSAGIPGTRLRYRGRLGGRGRVRARRSGCFGCASVVGAIGVALAAVSLLAFGAAAQEPPEGVPAAAVMAVVSGHVDGDKIEVDVRSAEEEVLMIGVDAPEPGECFADEAAERVEELVPEGAVVYLEAGGDDRDGKDRLLRWVWVPGEEGERAYLLNTRLVREGYAGFDPMEDNDKYDDRIEEAEAEAREDERGLWAACEGLHGEARAEVEDDEEIQDEEDEESQDEDGEDDAAGPLDTRLGGTRESFEAAYGEPVGEADERFGDYDIEGFGASAAAVFYEGRLARIQVFADRDLEDVPLSQPHEADWTVEEAIEVAERFAPTDAELGEPQPTNLGYVVYPAKSDELAEVFGADAYAWAEASGAPGSIEYVFSLDDAGEVYAIDVQLGGVVGVPFDAAAGSGEAPAPALVTDCGAFASYDEATAYYAANPASQPYLDPDADGLACEVHFGVEPEAPPPDTGPAPGAGCDPSYPTVCIPPPPPDRNCPDVGYTDFVVYQPDPHGLDRDRDGVGCES